MPAPVTTVTPMPIRKQAMRDPVEELLLPSLQQRIYSVFSIVAGRRLWRDFWKKARPGLEKPAAWSAATEFIMSEQGMHDVSQATVGQHYGISMAAMLPNIKSIKRTLNIKGLGERYSPFGTERILLKENSAE